jgi:hypothetical protein
MNDAANLTKRTARGHAVRVEFTRAEHAQLLECLASSQGGLLPGSDVHLG